MSADEATPAVAERGHVNVAAYLEEMARLQPESLAVAVAIGANRYERLSCAELASRCDRIAHGLERVGIGEGTRTVLMVKPSPEFFALTFALFKVGAVPVMVDPGMGRANLGRCLEEAEPEAFIGIPKAHAARLICGWAKRTVKRTVTVGRRLFWGGHTLAQLEEQSPDEPYAMRETPADKLAAILFTSGSTGPPKGVEYTHGIFAAQVRLLRTVYGIKPGERDLATFPLFALFGPALGMASIVPEMDASRPAAADPLKLVQALEDFECTNLFASPALLGNLARHCESTGTVLSSLKRAISAGAPVPGSTVECFSKALPSGAEIFTGYGATEAMPVASLDGKTILAQTREMSDMGAGTCVGKPVDELEVVIIPITEKPYESWSDNLQLPPGEIGEIVVKGPVVTASYYKRVAESRLAKLREPDGGAIRHRMGDLGYLDEQGRLWFCGRKAHRVQAGGKTLFSVPCEAIFNTHAAVFRSALVGVKRGAEVEPVICIELERKLAAEDRVALKRELLSLAEANPITESIQELLYHPAFPVDVRHNSKIFREKLAVWAARQLA